jgi:hypothetical protein
VIYERLLALPETATAKDVERIIGNDSWVGHRCVECRQYGCEFFQLGQEPDYESETVVVCPSCALKIADFIRRETATERTSLGSERGDPVL